MGSEEEPGPDGAPLLPGEESGGSRPVTPRPQARGFARGLGTSRLRNSLLSRRSAYELNEQQVLWPAQENKDSDVAFSIVVRREAPDGDSASEAPGVEEATLGIAHDLVNEVVQDAVQDACGQAVQDAVQEAVQDAIQQALEENVRFDVRANVFTLIAITGVILFWRGIWSLWDKLFGFSIWSELGSIAAGLIIMITFRLIGVPLLDGLPSG